jgi:hypothetical protein
MVELIGRIRHSVYDVPQPYFSLTLSNLIEHHQPLIASKFVHIIKEVAKVPGKLLSEFSSPEDRIRLFWSLIQIEQAATDPSIVNPSNLAFLFEVDP